ncbi:MAG: family 1 glycosylhydrolase [Saprospiraceae bacterium]
MRNMNEYSFFWGSSTAAAQIETAGAHPWRGLRALDGSIFERTTDHERRRMEDAELIAGLGDVYRCSVDWSRLQPAPFAPFDEAATAEYCDFFDALKARGVRLMFVLHHFCHPNWFEASGGWTNAGNIPAFLDYVERCVAAFGSYAPWWNTFNEPNVYAMNAFVLGNFPPRKRLRYLTANRVLDHMGRAHDQACDLIKCRFPDAQVGISLNTACFEGLNAAGRAVARAVDWWFHERAARPFRHCDFWGLSYYAWMLFDPLPIDAVSGRAKLQRLGLPYDDMWAYKPEGLYEILMRFWEKYGKPLIVTENGVCTDDAQLRVQRLRAYIGECERAKEAGADLRGYIHWSPWDNFEWHLGRAYRFGLYRVDFGTMERISTEASDFYRERVKTPL